ncbi:hypothetical protein FRC19_004140 [Serendipita sp. 401]|nr:hypothetical protein FRC19_004140 [Serendipita sp. 401]
MLSSTIIEGDPLLDGWKQVRAVCRAWRSLAGPQPHLVLGRAPLRNTDISHGTSGILVGPKLDQVIVLDALLRTPIIARNLITLAFGSAYSHQGEAIDTLLDNASSFPNLRCLSLSRIGCSRPFWKAIQDGFPDLIALTLLNHPVYGYDTGHYRLANLEILDIPPWHGCQLSCPSLKHLCIRELCNETVAEFLFKHGHQLESLLLDCDLKTNLILKIFPRFWSTFPNLQTFGKRLGLPPTLQAPPSSHPLQKLRIFSRIRCLDPVAILEELDFLRQITHVYLIVEDLQVGAEIQGKRELMRCCRKRGVELVALPMENKGRSKTKLRSWIVATVLAITCPCWCPFAMWFSYSGPRC